MINTINLSQFRDAFRDYNRQDNFSYEGLKALFGWIEELDDSCGTETELDVIGLCCDFCEYGSLKEFQADYGAQEYPDLESIEDNTWVINVDNGGFIIQAF